MQFVVGFNQLMKTIVILAVSLIFSGPSLCNSYYKSRVEDARAVYVTADKFPVHADGVGDDTDALQQAIDKVQETTTQGFFFFLRAVTAYQEPFISGREFAFLAMAPRALFSS